MIPAVRGRDFAQRSPIGLICGKGLARALVLALACASPFAAPAQSPPDATSSALVCATTPTLPSIAYMSDVIAMDRQLGLPLTWPITRGMRLTPEPDTLVQVGYDVRGRSVRMAPRAAAALNQMIAAAARDGVRLQMVSGFRTVAYQRHLVRSKLQRGMSIEAALRINAAPGFSEHHSGCAVDLTAPGAAPADEDFAETRAYRWLQAHAGRYGFHLSYPRENANGIEFEPWHWRYVAQTTTRAEPADTSAALPDPLAPASAATITSPGSE
jgi:D-alanyl-D-alanine carboxypeptidase